MALIIPDPRWQDPQLLRAYQKPIVDVVPSVPMDWCIGLSRTATGDIAQKRVLEGSNTELISVYGDRSLNFVAGLNSHLTVPVPRFSAADQPNNFTWFIKVRFRGNYSTDHGLFYLGDTAVGSQYVLVLWRDNVSGGNDRLGFAVSNYGASATVLYTPDGSMETQKEWHTVSCTRDGDRFSAVLDGVHTLETTKVWTNTIELALRIARRMEPTSKRLDGDIEIAFGLPFSLHIDEQIDLHRNPYKYFIPA